MILRHRRHPKLHAVSELVPHATHGRHKAKLNLILRAAQMDELPWQQADASAQEAAEPPPSPNLPSPQSLKKGLSRANPGAPACLVFLNSVLWTLSSCTEAAETNAVSPDDDTGLQDRWEEGASTEELSSLQGSVYSVGTIPGHGCHPMALVNNTLMQVTCVSRVRKAPTVPSC